ncbi:hypothetical protein BDV32DRAFT_127240 [Aspergillus pseudonomiae]|uniref:Uncharacterized protein n=1 Tax=Aspergillus pseudonomiae TaxID=1506151 RepID=A0A5N7DR43_9EURO|nr:uncharacterized protein BDV37DRAFT_278772 [Aspergillus pseudonomiae]KAB8257497.1 hypothetical protein BDV32DRAFT_127240 [Aspergillus pseudonomiae]KAE8408765.1 hypothetical protein BDV37DRAFT_278772 [Aspergillus pseudonomiae]
MTFVKTPVRAFTSLYSLSKVVQPSSTQHRCQIMANMTDLTEQPSNRAEGSIASAFASLSNQSIDLPARLLRLKQDISRGNGDAILDGWHRLLERVAVDKLAQWDSHMIPEIEFSAIKSNNGNLPDHAKQALKERGTIIVRGIVSPGEALAWKQRIRDCVSANPSTTGFPGDSSVLYIPAAPLCEVNSYYLRHQRNKFLQRAPLISLAVSARASTSTEALWTIYPIEANVLWVA